MRFLQNEGSYEILTPPEFIKEQLKIIERAGRTCYQSYRGKDVTEESATKFIRMLIRRGHESVIEHSSITVRFDNHSRGFTHELVRHRLCAFSQESTRYVDYALERNDERVVLPPTLTPGQMSLMESAMESAMEDYERLRDSGVPAEDARQILPIGTKSEIVCSANLREWRHIFSMRTGKPAHWEIRRTMCLLLEEMKELLPGVFDDFEFAGYCRSEIPHYIQLNNTD